MSEGAEDTGGPPPVPADRAPGWWAWPLIALSVFFVGWSVNLFHSGDEPPAEESGNGAAAPTELALFKIQSQMVIAAASVNSGDAAETIEELREYAEGDRMFASLALLESFVSTGGIDPGETLEKISGKAPGALRTLSRKAIDSGIDEEEREELFGLVGWFALLAPAPGLEDAPEANRIKARAMLVLALAVMVFLGALCAVVTGGILIFLGYRKQREHGSLLAFQSQATPRGVMLECFALYLGIMASGELLGLFGPGLGPAGSSIFSHPAFLAVVYGSAVVIPLLWPLFRGVAWPVFFRSLGFHTGRGCRRSQFHSSADLSSGRSFGNRTGW
jgi:hypothetical protein